MPLGQDVSEPRLRRFCVEAAALGDREACGMGSRVPAHRAGAAGTSQGTLAPACDRHPLGAERVGSLAAAELRAQTCQQAKKRR
ncbi:hypothetical protein LEMLEM_LOCUS7088 [Lemmus lemmus]